MELTTTRRWLTPNSSIGELVVDGKPFGYTLEDFRREPGEAKVPKETAIPEGRYEVQIGWSAKFARPMPQVVNVPGFRHILIHTGNTKDDTEGCVLVGLTRDVDKVLNSRVAFEKLFTMIESAIDAGDQVFLTIKTAPPAERDVC